MGLGFLQEMFGHGIHRLLWSAGIVLAIICTWTLTMPAGNVEATGDQSPAPLRSQTARLSPSQNRHGVDIRTLIAVGIVVAVTALLLLTI